MATTVSGELEITTVRQLDFPRETVFNAWIDPTLLAQWWGPNGFTNTFNVFEPKPGGTWEFTMHGPNGKDFYNRSVFEEIVFPERIRFTHLESMHVFHVTATFKEVEGKTEITFHMRFEDAEDFETVKLYAPTLNEQNFDRLETVLERGRER